MTVLGFPFRVEPSFWFITGLVAIAQAGRENLWAIPAWILAVFFAILIHELGHALVGRTFGLYPGIVLHGFGGTTYWSRGRDVSPWRSVAISVAGPGAGFVLGGFVTVGMAFVGSGHAAFSLFLSYLWFTTIYWGVLNLLPMLPLDGGNVVMALGRRYFPNVPRLPWYISGITAAALCVLCIASGNWWWLYISGRAAYDAWVAIQTLPAASRARPAPRPPSVAIPFATAAERVKAAEAARATSAEDPLKRARAAFIRAPSATTGAELVTVFAAARRFSALAAIAAGADGLVIEGGALLGAAEAALEGGVPQSAIGLGELAFKRGAGAAAAAIVARGHGRLGEREEALRWVRAALEAGASAASLKARSELELLADDPIWLPEA